MPTFRKTSATYSPLSDTDDMEIADDAAEVVPARAAQIATSTVDRPLPNGWRRVKFGDVVRNVDINEHNPLDKGFERYVGLDHLDPESLHIKRWGLVADGTTFTRTFKPGQVLFGKRRAYQRKAAVAEFDGICSGDILVFEPLNHDLTTELLPFIVQSEGFFNHALGTSAGSLSPRTKWKDLSDYEFALPPREEQRRIAKILWAADEAIKTQGQVYLELSIAKNQVFEYLSKSEAVNDQKIRADTLLKYAIFITDGDHNPPKRQEYGIPHVVVKHIMKRNINLSDCTYISSLSFEITKKRYDPRPGDVIITCVGTVGRVALVPEGLVFSADRSLAIVRFDPTLVIPAYGIEVLDSYSVQKQIEMRAIGTAQKHLYLKDIRGLEVRIPSLARQRQILKHIERFDIALEKSNSHLCQLEQVKKSLLYSLLAL